MYALEDYLGEEKLNHAIAEYLRSVAYQDPPYTNSLELIEQIRRVTPPELLYLIEDLFETITLYDNRAVAATYRKWRPIDMKYDCQSRSKNCAPTTRALKPSFHWPTSSTSAFWTTRATCWSWRRNVSTLLKAFSLSKSSHPRQGRHRSAEHAHRSQA